MSAERLLSGQEKKMDWVEHFEELRGRLFVMLGAVGVFSVVSYFFTDPLFQLLVGPLKPMQQTLYFTRPYEAFLVKLSLSCFSGVLLGSPVIFAQLWRFIAPGLYEKEKKLAAAAVAATAACFFTGIAFGFFVVVPFALRFFLGFQTAELQPLLSVKEYISFLVTFLLAFGIAFMFPIVLLTLVRLGIIHPCQLAQQRRTAVLVIFIAAAVLTPSTDVISQLLLAGPLVVLFEIAVFFAWRIQKKAPPAS